MFQLRRSHDRPEATPPVDDYGPAHRKSFEGRAPLCEDDVVLGKQLFGPIAMATHAQSVNIERDAGALTRCARCFEESVFLCVVAKYSRPPRFRGQRCAWAKFFQVNKM